MQYRAVCLVSPGGIGYTGRIRALYRGVVTDGWGTRRMHRSSRRHLIGLSRITLAVALLLAGLAAITIFQLPHVRAAGLDPVIHWDSNMIYPGQNNGYPWGPVGELATVHGDKFTASSVLGQTIKLALIQGDVNNPPGGGSSYEFCKLAGPKIAVGQANVDGSGKFDFNFTWPAAAGSGMYSICAYNTLDGLPAGNIDDGPFSVLSGAPSLAVSRSSVGQGESITLTGKNWTPPQDVNVYIAACVDCDGPIVVAGTAHSSGLHAGTFSMTFTIPSGATPGKYVAGANAHGGVLDVGPTGGKQVTITAAAATATTQSSPTAAQATAATGAGGENSNGDNANALGVSPLVLILLVVGIGLLILALIILLAVMLSRRGGKRPPASAMGGSPPGWGGPYSGYGADVPPPGVGTVQQNWRTLPPGWGDQTPPTVSPGMPQGDDSPTRANFSQIPNPAYPPAPPPNYPAPGGDTPTQPGRYNEGPPD